MYMYTHVRIATLKSAQNIINVQDILNDSTRSHYRVCNHLLGLIQFHQDPELKVLTYTVCTYDVCINKPHLHVPIEKQAYIVCRGEVVIVCLDLRV